MAEECHPEMDDSPLLDSAGTSKFRSVIGSLNWMITLGRINVSYATNVLSRFNTAPREGHLTATKRILGYLKSSAKGKLLFDTSFPYHSQYKTEDHAN